MKKLLFSLLFLPFLATAQTDTEDEPASVPKKEEKWYDKINIRGYLQVRYNRLLETNGQLSCEQCDKSWGENGGFFIRRARVIFFGQVHKQVYFYIQPDFASSANGGLNFGQIRDAYLDVGLDKKNEYRFRIGQSKVPFGFENMQSSQNRLPLDRADALNSAISNERDIGVFFYWAPDKIRQRFSSLVREGLKGSGDYGVLGLGVFNGQSANRPELNNRQHVVARLSYPMKVGSQMIEPSLQGYTGRYVIPEDQISDGTKVAADRSYIDQRAAASFVLYPQPFGIQAEYNIGRGPEFNPATDSIETKSLTGGYATLNYMIRVNEHHTIYPFFRMQYYNGGKKFEQDARSYTVNEYELGIEWEPIENFELVVMYTSSSRRFEDFEKQNNTQQGQLMRIQAQLNF